MLTLRCHGDGVCPNNGTFSEVGGAACVCVCVCVCVCKSSHYCVNLCSWLLWCGPSPLCVCVCVCVCASDYSLANSQINGDYAGWVCSLHSHAAAPSGYLTAEEPHHTVQPKQPRYCSYTYSEKPNNSTKNMKRLRQTMPDRRASIERETDMLINTLTWQIMLDISMLASELTTLSPDVLLCLSQNGCRAHHLSRLPECWRNPNRPIR